LALACMERLIARGYDIDIERYCKRRLPLLEERDKESFQHIVARLGWTPLHVAVTRSPLDRIAALLAAGARPDAPARNGDTPLHLAAGAGDEGVLRLLRSRKATLDGKDSAGRTAAQIAARGDHDDCALLLLKRGCSVPDILVASLAGRADLVRGFLKAN